MLGRVLSWQKWRGFAAPPYFEAYGTPEYLWQLKLEERHLARPCTICSNPNRDAINEAVLQGDPLKQVAICFGVSDDALGRHKKHLNLVAEVIARNRAQSEPDRGQIFNLLASATKTLERVLDEIAKDTPPLVAPTMSADYDTGAINGKEFNCAFCGVNYCAIWRRVAHVYSRRRSFVGRALGLYCADKRLIFPVCSESCKDALDQYMEHNFKKRRTEWLQISQSRKLLVKAKSHLNRNRESAPLSSPQKESVPVANSQC